jgi:hypothetical protein
MEDKEYTHESYGLVEFNRISGGNGRLFGSSVEHQHSIRIRVSQATLIRSNLHYDRYFTKDRIVEIDMSPTQFAEAITSMNTMGNPCTIRSRVGSDGEYKSIEPCPFMNKREQFENEFKDIMDNASEDITNTSEEIEEILAKKTVNKGDREIIRGLLYRIKMSLTDKAPFMAKMYNEQLDKTAAEAKGEIEAFAEHKLRSIGIDNIESVLPIYDSEPQKQIKEQTD